jgi:O-antigen/teichoic acid export membrane protein
LLRGSLNSTLLRRTFVYTLAGSFNGLIAFLLLPVLTRYLSPSDYGIVETFMVITACLTGVVLIGGNTILAKDYFRFSAEDRQKYVSDILGVTAVASGLLVAGFLIFSASGDFFSDLLKISNSLILLAILVSFGNAVITLALTLFQLEKKPGVYALVLNAKSLVEVTISVFLVTALDLGWKGRVAGIATAAALFAIVAFGIFKASRIRTAFPIRHGKPLLILGIPLVFAHIAGWIGGMIDRMMINSFLGLESNGLYSVGARFGMVVMMVESAFSQAWLPFFYENIKQGSPQEDLKIVRVTYLYIVFLILFSLAFGLSGKYLLYLVVDEKFYGAAPVILVASFAHCFGGIWKMFTGYLIYEGRTKTYSLILIGSAVVTVFLNYVLLPRIGFLGGAWSTLIAWALGAVATAIAANRCHAMPWSLAVGPKPRLVQLPDRNS